MDADDPNRESTSKDAKDSNKKQETVLCMGSCKFMNRRWSEATPEVQCVSLTLASTFEFAAIPANVPKDGNIACCLSGGSVVVSGVGDSQKECMKLNITDKKWYECGTLGVRRRGQCMAAVGSSVYVFGGHTPGREYSGNNLVQDIEKYDSDQNIWSACGHILGSYCYNTCCCPYLNNIYIYGIQDQNEMRIIQSFDPALGSTSCIFKIPQWGESVQVFGIAVVKDMFVMADGNGVYVSPADRILCGDASRLTRCTNFQTPNQFCAMSLVNERVTLLGGNAREGYAKRFLYMTTVENLSQNCEDGWEEVEGDWPADECCIFPGACCVLPS